MLAAFLFNVLIHICHGDQLHHQLIKHGNRPAPVALALHKPHVDAYHAPVVSQSPVYLGQPAAVHGYGDHIAPVAAVQMPVHASYSQQPSGYDQPAASNVYESVYPGTDYASPQTPVYHTTPPPTYHPPSEPYLSKPASYQLPAYHPTPSPVSYTPSPPVPTYHSEPEPYLASPAPSYNPKPDPVPVYHPPKASPVYHPPTKTHVPNLYKPPAPKTYLKKTPPVYKDESPKPYSYEYAVADDYSKAAFNAHESSDGNAVTGGYSVVLPDGRIQHVKYTADHYNGFIAEVTGQSFAEDL